MLNQRVLVVDDEADFRMVIGKILKDEHFVVLEAGDGEQGEKVARESHPDIILLDWNLPRKDGIDVCKCLKVDPATRGIPILMLTSRSRENDTVIALEVGADDYITKRVLRKREIVARVRVLLRRASLPVDAGGETLDMGKLSIDTSRRLVTVGGKPVALRMKEFDLLYTFAKRPGRVLSRNFLSETVWGDPYFGTTRTIDMTIAHLRSLLGSEGRRIESLIGLGYKFNE
jgi:two-component system phosphate regulon response regulator PhoB